PFANVAKLVIPRSIADSLPNVLFGKGIPSSKTTETKYLFVILFVIVQVLILEFSGSFRCNTAVTLPILGILTRSDLKSNRILCGKVKDCFEYLFLNFGNPGFSPVFILRKKFLNPLSRFPILC